MKPIASFGPQTSTTLSPITISTTPDCTTNMVEPASPRLNTWLPAAKLMRCPPCARTAACRDRCRPLLMPPRARRRCNLYTIMRAGRQNPAAVWAWLSHRSQRQGVDQADVAEQEACAERLATINILRRLIVGVQVFLVRRLKQAASAGLVALGCVST